jgi:hypothetical protein
MFEFKRNIFIDNKESILDYVLAIGIGICLACLMLAYFDVLIK